ncbi:hypothetical protein ACIOEX_04825 [Streptomyces sp. NPDC087850]|uniref:hypothetical protein n=1 Tax=Streptomyces sp. NPDC087850 TaxID=3365809 RepID=UPI00380995AA
MRQFPALPTLSALSGLSGPGRLAVWLVTSLAVATSTGCMSVGGDDGEPAPSHTADGRAGVVEPDGVTGTGVGSGMPHVWRSGAGKGGEERVGAGPASKGEDGAEADGKDPEKAAGASPKASSQASPAAPVEKPEVTRGPGQGPGKPTPPGGGDPVPTHEPTRPAPTPVQPSQQPEPPGPEPEPEPTKPVDQPSASPAADVRTGTLAAAEAAGTWREPKASPQVGPV